MQVTALVVWPISVKIEVDDKELAILSQDNQEELIRERLLDVAGDILASSTIHPIIQDCSVESLIE